MKFSEWWDLRMGQSYKENVSYRYRDVKKWAALAWIDAFQEGFKLGKAASKAHTQGGGSQEPCSGCKEAVYEKCPYRCKGA